MAELRPDIDLTEALGIDRAFVALRGTISEGLAKAYDMAMGIPDRIHAWYDDARSVVVTQNPDGSGTVNFEGPYQDTADRGTAASAAKPTSVGGSLLPDPLGWVVLTAFAGILLTRLWRR